MDQTYLKIAIELKREELNSLPIDSGFTDEHIKVSTELDMLLNQLLISQKSAAK